jgi:dCMP deaminase
MLHRPDWDTLFLALAFVVAQRSPDAETKHGAVVVDAKRRVLGTGFNGFPRGAKDHKLPSARPGKYPFVIHAEANALINCRGIDNPEECTIYVTGEPCNECFKQIIQYGIGRVVFAGVGSSCIDTDEEHTYVRNAIQEGSTIQIEQRGDDIAGVVELLTAAADYAKARGGAPTHS